MKLRLFPQEPAGLNLLSEMARQIVLATATLAEILGVPAAEHGNEAHASKLTRNSHQVVKTAEDLEHAANAWRLGELD